MFQPRIMDFVIFFFFFKTWVYYGLNNVVYDFIAKYWCFIILNINLNININMNNYLINL